MSSHPDRGARRTQRDEVERILSLVPGCPAAEAEALVALFASAVGPIPAGQLQGEARAVAAFRVARPAPAGPGRKAKILATALTVKTAAAALLLTSVGGVALAATTGVLPTPLTTDSRSADRSKDSAGHGTGDLTPADAGEAAVRDAAKAAAAADRADDQAGRDHAASYAGLCQAFTSGAWDNPKAAENPAFSRLIAAAPQGNVGAFCSALAAEAPSAKIPGAGKAKTAAQKKAAEKAAANSKAAAAHKKAASKSKGAEARNTASGKSTAAEAREKAAESKSAVTPQKARDNGTANPTRSRGGPSAG
ncbi:MAG TPA: hypothetical protein VMZ00_09910 [Sporichthya sp.]|nr:hypothetical protein [Sporichthya sp.]